MSPTSKREEPIPSVSPRELEWKRVGDLIRARREELGMTQQDVARLGGPSPATQRQLEGGSGILVRSNTLGQLEDALGWQRGSVKQVLRGGEPIAVATAPPGLMQTRSMNEGAALGLILERLEQLDARMRRVEHRRFSESGRITTAGRTVRLPADLWEAVDRRAADLSVSPNEVVRSAVETLLDEL